MAGGLERRSTLRGRPFRVALTATALLVAIASPVFTPTAGDAKASGLMLVVTADSTQVSPGQALGFDTRLSDSRSDAINTISLQQPLPAGSGVNWSLASQSGTSCAVSGVPPSQTLTCSIGSIAAGQSYAVHVVGATTSASAGTYPTTATATAPKQPALTATTNAR